MTLPQQLNLGAYFEEVRNGSVKDGVDEGDIWMAVPDGSWAELYDERTWGIGEQTPIGNSAGIVTNAKYQRIGRGPSIPWLKITIDPDGKFSTTAFFDGEKSPIGIRSGAVIGDVQEYADVAALVPGFSRSCSDSLGRLPQLTVDYSASEARCLIGRNEIHYAYHGIWSVSLDDLLGFRASINDGKIAHRVAVCVAQ
jgi:hypothetical protein